MLDPVTLCDIHSEKISGLFLQPWGLHSISILKKQFKLVLTKFYITLVLFTSSWQYTCTFYMVHFSDTAKTLQFCPDMPV